MACVFIRKTVNVNYVNSTFLHRPLIILQSQWSNYSDNVKTVNPESPIDVLKNKISKGELMNDEHQLKVAEDLQTVYQSLKGYIPEKESFLSKWMGKGKKKKKAPKGLYLFGAVGGGKTMLMDLFYNCCQVSQSSFWHVLQLVMNLSSYLNRKILCAIHVSFLCIFLKFI